MARSKQGRYTPPKRVAVVFANEISDDASAFDKERAARRRLVATTGRCPCGAQLELPDVLVPGALTVIAVEHEPGCPAIDGASS